jgi:hypothetical protein
VNASERSGSLATVLVIPNLRAGFIKPLIRNAVVMRKLLEDCQSVHTTLILCRGLTPQEI